jgi:hypothetical protein
MGADGGSGSGWRGGVSRSKKTILSVVFSALWGASGGLKELNG